VRNGSLFRITSRMGLCVQVGDPIRILGAQGASLSCSSRTGELLASAQQNYPGYVKVEDLDDEQLCELHRLLSAGLIECRPEMVQSEVVGGEEMPADEHVVASASPELSDDDLIAEEASGEEESASAVVPLFSDSEDEVADDARPREASSQSDLDSESDMDSDDEEPRRPRPVTAKPKQKAKPGKQGKGAVREQQASSSAGAASHKKHGRNDHSNQGQGAGKHGKRQRVRV
jgi:hypothetical protein